MIDFCLVVQNRFNADTHGDAADPLQSPDNPGSSLNDRWSQNMYFVRQVLILKFTEQITGVILDLN